MPRSEAFVIHEDDCAFEGSDQSAFGPVRWRTLISADRTPTESVTVGVAELEPLHGGDSPSLHPGTLLGLHGDRGPQEQGPDQQRCPVHVVF